MAISILLNPGGSIKTKPAYEFLKYVFTSDNSEIVQMQFDVYREEGVTDTLIATAIHDLDINTSNQFTFDIQSIIQDDLSFDLPTIDSTTEYLAVNSRKDYYVTATELYLDSVTGLIESSSDYTTNVLSAANWTEEFTDRINFSIADYDMKTSSAGQFLTNSPSEKTIRLDENEFLGVSYIDFISAQTTSLRLKVYTNNNKTSSAEYTMYTVGNSAADNDDNYKTLPVGTANLVGFDFESFFNSGLKYFDVYVRASGGTIISEVKSYKLVGSCDNDVRIHWQNPYGKIDSYTFSGEHNKTKKMKSSVYRQVLQSGFTYSDRGLNVYNNEYIIEHELYSQTENQETIEWLSEIMINNRAYIEENKNLIPIIILDGEAVTNSTTDVVTQFKIKYVIANEITPLRG